MKINQVYNEQSRLMRRARKDYICESCGCKIDSGQRYLSIDVYLPLSKKFQKVHFCLFCRKIHYTQKSNTLDFEVFAPISGKPGTWKFTPGSPLEGTGEAEILTLRQRIWAYNRQESARMDDRDKAEKKQYNG